MIVRLIVCLIISLLWQPFSIASGEVKNSPLKVGFIYTGPLKDLGWNSYHEEGRLYLEHMLRGQVQTIVAENVPASAESERVMERMVLQGVKVIFTTSYGFLEPALKVAQRHPEVVFLQCSERANPKPIANLSTYFGNYYKTSYVVGTIAGKMTKKNEIGFIGGYAIPPVLLNLNAFTLGARSVNPKIKVHVVWTNSWYDPPTESEAARGLIEQGIDIVAADTHAAAIVQSADKSHVYSIAFNADLNRLVPDTWLTGTKWNWGPLYVKMVKSIIEHRWRAGDYRYDMQYDCMQLSTIGKMVPLVVKQKALELMAAVKQGKVSVFNGPLTDREGRIVIPAGKVVDEAFLGKTEWVAQGVVGSVPRK